MIPERFHSADEQRAREAFILRFIVEYGKDSKARRDEIKRTIDELSLPFDIRDDLKAWLAGEGVVPGGGAVEGVHQVPIWIGRATLGAYPEGTPPEKRFSIVHDRAVIVGQDSSNEPRTIHRIEIEAANLSAAKRGAAAAVVELWGRLGWPKNPQPYANAERDAEWLFDYWCKGISYDEMGLEHKLGTETVRAAIRRARRHLGFKGRRPSAGRRREARIAPSNW